MLTVYTERVGVSSWPSSNNVCLVHIGESAVYRLKRIVFNPTLEKGKYSFFVIVTIFLWIYK